MIIIGVVFMFIVICVQQSIIRGQRKVLDEIDANLRDLIEPEKFRPNQSFCRQKPVKLSRVQ